MISRRRHSGASRSGAHGNPGLPAGRRHGGQPRQERIAGVEGHVHDHLHDGSAREQRGGQPLRELDHELDAAVEGMAQQIERGGDELVEIGRHAGVRLPAAHGEDALVELRRLHDRVLDRTEHLEQPGVVGVGRLDLPHLHQHGGE
jgi:hypothetical protein